MLKNPAETAKKQNRAIDSRQFNNTHVQFPLVDPKVQSPLASPLIRKSLSKFSCSPRCFGRLYEHSSPDVLGDFTNTLVPPFLRGARGDRV